jgi:CRISPR-associated protein Cas2
VVERKKMYLILVYDIVMDNEGKKILPKVYKCCKKYLTHIQNSVFEGELQISQILGLQSELQGFIRKDKDSVIIFKSRSERWLQKEFWGKEDDKMSFII